MEEKIKALGIEIGKTSEGTSSIYKFSISKLADQEHIVPYSAEDINKLDCGTSKGMLER